MPSLSLNAFTESLARALHATLDGADTIRIAVADDACGILHTPRFWAEYQDGRPFDEIVQTLQQMMSGIAAQQREESRAQTITPQQIQPHLVLRDRIAENNLLITPRFLASDLAEIVVADYPDHVQWMTNDLLTAPYATTQAAWALADQNRAGRAQSGQPIAANVPIGGAMWNGPMAADQAWDTVRNQPGSLFFAPATEFAYAWPGGALEPLRTLLALLPIFYHLADTLPQSYHQLTANAWVVQPHHTLLPFNQFVETLLESTAETLPD